MTKRWGKLKHARCPLVFIGIQHEMLAPGHLWCHQTAYLDKLKPIVVSKARLQHTTAKCSAKEHFDFRSCVCAMLWLCLTRLDMIAEVVDLQRSMVAPLVADLKKANAALAKARQNRQMNGLAF